MSSYLYSPAYNAVDTCGNAGAKADALMSGGAPGYVATDRPLTLRSCGAIAKPMPEKRDRKKCHACRHKNLPKWHTTKNAPHLFFTLTPDEGTRNETTGMSIADDAQSWIANYGAPSLF